MRPDLNNIKPSEHVFVAGKTGTGKSKLAEIYLAGFERVIKLDTKNEQEANRKRGLPLWQGLEEYIDFEVCYNLAEVQASEFHHVIYVPSVEEMSLEGYNDFLQWCYDEQDVTVWIDELMSVCQSPQVYPPALKAIMTRGRSRNVAVWACTQRTLDNPAIVLANTTHFFIFALQLDQDRKKIMNATGCPEFWDKPEGHWFLYYRDGWDKPVKAIMKMPSTTNGRG